MNTTATTVSSRVSFSRILVLATGALTAMALGAAIALAATGWFAGGASTAAPAFDPTAALQGHVLREYRAAGAVPALVVDDALHEHVLRENGGS
jgi:hypothetical protein